eukprot:CAMPEP_0173434788 /NCGR_PEP_ID=MMETSP1357-20121228/13460_1 /TAXON_ID=77926 /ORGANISM="Hemiselmis rufescens, Strain PCC563" /LENGTH=88 /DNA_ID=CAMNT_0014399691 /DNA_START=180 /DNA_END=442 /DNA_ORIENTATION=+
MISCFFDRTLRNVKSFWGSSSRTAERALEHSCVMRPAYCTVTACSSVVRMGMPSWFTMTTPLTPLCSLSRRSVSSTSLGTPLAIPFKR